MEGFVNFNQGNFDPNQLANQTSSVIMFSVVTDVSVSTRNFAKDMNLALKDLFMSELKNCHRKDDIVIQNITFGSKVTIKSGFMPILNLQDDYLEVDPSESATALYEGVETALKSSIAYREDLENQGVDVRSCIFIITDGDDNNSAFGTANKVKDIVNGLKSNESWINSFSINMLGVGKDSVFRQSCIDMGLDPNKMLSTIGTSSAEIRKQIGVISQSVSASQAGNGVSF